jgi:hypothetical protein
MKIDTGVLTLTNGDKVRLSDATVSVLEHGVLKVVMAGKETHYSPSGWQSYTRPHKKPASPRLGVSA